MVIMMDGRTDADDVLGDSAIQALVDYMSKTSSGDSGITKDLIVEAVRGLRIFARLGNASDAQEGSR